MFVMNRISAADALKEAWRNAVGLGLARMNLIRRVVDKADRSESFATELDFECANAFEGGMADGFDDLLNLFDDMPDGLRDLLRRHGVLVGRAGHA